MVRLGEKQSVAVSSRVRSALQGNNISQELIRNTLAKFDVKGRAANNTFNLNLNAFAEWDVTYARVLTEEGPHFLKAGVTVKRLMEAGSAYLQAKTVDYEIIDKATAVNDTTVRLHNLDATFGYSNPDAFDDLDAKTAAKWLTSGGAPGTGWGADFGVVYEYRPDAEQYRYRDAKGKEHADHGRNKYHFRVSAAITDLGSIRYDKQAVAYNATKVRNLGVSESDINGGNIGNFYQRVSDIVRAQQQAKEDHFRAGLPTALNVDVDYHVGWKLYANAAVSQGLRGRYAVGMRTFSYVAFTPRFETRWLELAAPFSLINNYRIPAYGLAARLGPLTVGTNNLPALFSSSNPYGANVFAELSLLTWASKSHKNRPAKPARAPKAPKS
ncbi:hypothetical protein GCM10011383_07670 [Hymenobacter cavernae]|uniref:DUF5723 domain-containing protein n=2 Tax=Hymenobacter cavernae TaxID=2044852 RepID=A0ABQ1TMV2_9BACT|nr:hypothetical protein GCM10011383_07670 [Hymenobacter cavernae]